MISSPASGFRSRHCSRTTPSDREPSPMDLTSNHTMPTTTEIAFLLPSPACATA